MKNKLKNITDENLLDLMEETYNCKNSSYSEKYQADINAEFEERMKHKSLGRFPNVKKIRTTESEK